MIKKLIIVGLAIAASIWVGMYIQSYNGQKTMSAQERFKAIIDQAGEQSKDLLSEANKEKKKAIEVIKDKRDAFLQHQQKELFY